uniref:Toxoplasma gondii family C protein n=1 Tax=Toxoplasma gondii (strain ATCC 50861 / VEG) TaxID=432359 RepID=A0A0F7V507_TOXGV|nr:TPA: Toxoplasma gondii family C protein [Toxoplasma gondii VEG]
MKPTPGRVVLSPVVTRGENRLVNMIEKKLSGFPSGLQLTAQLKARRGLLFRRGSSVLLLSVALCLVVLAPFVPFDCPTRRTCTALADAVTSLETDTGWNDSSSWTDTQQDTAVEGSADAREDGSATELDGGGTEGDGSATELDGGATDVYGGATDADGGAIDVEGGVTEGMSMTLGDATESYAIESLRAPSRSPSVAALVPRIHRSRQARPIVVSGILASVVLSIILGAIFLNSDRILITETTPSPSKSSDASRESIHPADIGWNDSGVTDDTYIKYCITLWLRRRGGWMIGQLRWNV